MTLAEIEQAAREKYNAVGETFWSQSEIRQLIYQACVELAIETKCIERTYTTTTVASTAEYAYPTNTISIKRVTYNSVRIDPIDFDQADSITGINALTVTTGSPVGYTSWNFTLTLSPTPSEAKTLKIYSYNLPQDLTASSTLEVPTFMHASIINYCVREMCAKDSNFNAAGYYGGLWDADKLRHKRFIQKRRRGDRFASVKDEESLPGLYTG